MLQDTSINSSLNSSFLVLLLLLIFPFPFVCLMYMKINIKNMRVTETVIEKRIWMYMSKDMQLNSLLYSHKATSFKDTKKMHLIFLHFSFRHILLFGGISYLYDYILMLAMLNAMCACAFKFRTRSFVAPQSISTFLRRDTAWENKVFFSVCFFVLVRQESFYVQFQVRCNSIAVTLYRWEKDGLRMQDDLLPAHAVVYFSILCGILFKIYSCEFLGCGWNGMLLKVFFVKNLLL